MTGTLLTMNIQEIQQTTRMVYGLMMKLRDGLQSPSALNPSIDQKIELLNYMEKLGIQKVDLGLPGAGPFLRTY